MSGIRLLVVAAGLLAIAIFSVQNAAPAALTFFLWTSIQVPVGVLLTGLLAAGLLFSTLLFPLGRE
ncbi:DUF1049 domain-containing protein [Lyngbya confervoides]|uniref:DUF1049 domain-containing protein n=1 Tax=Lyngbya confervoides BDU141951 TaxID=1574623 RepID=A0ABD4T507_9CYAN|nr:DUF1049 domain-containing protein [Lyngbya confervoides]MCM1983516.1 DUF1049 domain-containing protein [Lyngbya confervoides BDU141951]